MQPESGRAARTPWRLLAALQIVAVQVQLTALETKPNQHFCAAKLTLQYCNNRLQIFTPILFGSMLRSTSMRHFSDSGVSFTAKWPGAAPAIDMDVAWDAVVPPCMYS